MIPKKHVVVVRGGMSAEYEVSMNSGQMVLDNLDRDRYKVSAVEIARSGEWIFEDGEYTDAADAFSRLRALHTDCVFIALHGPYGEDGRIQGMLDLLGIPYTGSGCAASAIAIDKTRSKILARDVGISVPAQVEFTRNQWQAEAKEISERVGSALGYPCVVKSPRQGSSLGMGIPQNRNEFAPVVEEVLGFGYRVMVEEFITGVEVTCGVLDVEEIEEPVALPVTEIRPVKARYFDYQAKYTPDATEEITPAEIEDDVRDAIQRMAISAHEVIGCRGFSRSDMILSDSGAVWLEINTIPGFTKTSLYPQAAAAAGIPFPELLTKFVEAALL